MLTRAVTIVLFREWLSSVLDELLDQLTPSTVTTLWAVRPLK
jgi:hypothetical protein